MLMALTGAEHALTGWCSVSTSRLSSPLLVPPFFSPFSGSCGWRRSIPPTILSRGGATHPWSRVGRVRKGEESGL